MGSRVQVIVVASSSGSQGAVRDGKHAGADALTARHVQPAVHPHTAASCCGPVRDLLLRFGLTLRPLILLANAGLAPELKHLRQSEVPAVVLLEGSAFRIRLEAAA